MELLIFKPKPGDHGQHLTIKIAFGQPLPE